MCTRLSHWCRCHRGLLVLLLAVVGLSPLSAQFGAPAVPVFEADFAVFGDEIQITGENLPRIIGRWNADRTLFTIVVEQVNFSDVTGDSQPHEAEVIRAVSLIEDDGTERDSTLVVETAPGAEAEVWISPNANDARVTFTVPTEREESQTQEPEREGFQVVQLRYGDAQAMSNLLKRISGGNDRTIQVDERLNLLIIDRESPRYLSLIELVQVLDQPGEQILIDAQIVELRTGAASQLGLDLPSSITMGVGEDSGFDNMIEFPLQTFLRSPIELSATLNLLQGDGRADILANPRVATVGGIPAVVQTQDRFPIIVTQSSGNQTFQTKQDIVGGISLSITPRHNGEGEITTVIETDVTTITGTTNEGFPTTSSRQVSTTVRVQSGQAIVIGGLQERRVIEHADRFPVLGHIPFLGALFTSYREDIQETDLYVIVTPYLIGERESEN